MQSKNVTVIENKCCHGNPIQPVTLYLCSEKQHHITYIKALMNWLSSLSTLSRWCRLGYTVIQCYVMVTLMKQTHVNTQALLLCNIHLYLHSVSVSLLALSVMFTPFLSFHSSSRWPERHTSDSSIIPKWPQLEAEIPTFMRRQQDTDYWWIKHMNTQGAPWLQDLTAAQLWILHWMNLSDSLTETLVLWKKRRSQQSFVECNSPLLFSPASPPKALTGRWGL